MLHTEIGAMKNQSRSACRVERSAIMHDVMFAIRPFWRWQTQGTYSLGFNAIMNWNDLDAGKADARPGTTSQQ